MCMVQKRELKYRMIDILILFLINLMTLLIKGAYQKSFLLPVSYSPYTDRIHAHALDGQASHPHILQSYVTFPLLSL